MRRIAAFIALLLALISTTARAEYPARPDGPVADYAHILSPSDEASLDAKLRQWSQKSGWPIVVATVPSLEGDTIEQYSADLYKTWGIGPKGTDTGVLFLVAPSERKVRIEVGYGLTPYITDILSGRIIRNDVTPRFKSGDFAGGINSGVDALIAQLSRNPTDAKAVAEAAKNAEQHERNGGGFPIGALFWFAFLFFFFILPMFGRSRRRRRYRSPWGNAARDIMLWEVGKGIARSFSDHDDWGGGGGFGSGGGGGFGGFGGGMSGGGGASGGW